MRASWFEGIAAGAYLAVSSLALVSGAALSAAYANDGTAVEARIPVPEPANLPPPTVADLEPAATTRVHGPRDAAAAREITGTVSAPSGTAAAPAEPAAAPAQTAAAPDAPLRAKLGELVAGRLDRFVERKRDRASVEEFYAARQFAPLWIADGAPTERMKAAIARLKAADADGLEADDYATPDLKTLGSDPEALAAAELKLTASVLEYARDAQIGRVAPSRISTANIEYNLTPTEPAEVLQRVGEAADAAEALAAFNPPHAGYKALRDKLAELRGRGDDPARMAVGSGPTLREGMSDKRVPALRERLGLVALSTDSVYDAELVEAVKAFQRSKGLGGKGALTPATVDALNSRGAKGEIETVVSNMERWRWLPRDLGRAYVMVNVPDFTLKMVRGGDVVFRTKVVVGKPETPTPLFSDEIENIVVNPTWHVPQSIIYNEYLPALERDPGALSRMGLKLARARDGSISITQPPGERNALGQMKFNFPNRFNVYLHDTPTKHLFAQERRAYSHGCMRVQNPTQFGEALLATAGATQEHFSADRLKGMFNAGERWLKLKPFVSVHVTYMNAFVDDAGKLVIRDDLYGLDGRVKAALRGEAVVAEKAEPKPDRRPARAAGAERRVASGNGERGDRAAAAPAARRYERQQVVYEQPRMQPPQPGFFFFPFFR